MVAVTKASKTRLFKTAETYCLAFLEAGRSPGVSRACSLKAVGENLFSASPLGFWCCQPAWHALAGGYSSPVSASIITWPLSSLCVNVAVFLSGHQSYGIWRPSYSRMTLSPLFTSATTPFPNKITFQDYGKDRSFGRTLFIPIHGTRSRLLWGLRH